MSDPTAAVLTIAVQSPTIEVTANATPAVFVIATVPAEPEPGGDAEPGTRCGLGLSLSL